VFVDLTEHDVVVLGGAQKRQLDRPDRLNIKVGRRDSDVD
jgi:hypothetical protein